MTTEPTRLERLMSGGAEIAGGAVAGALGFLAAGPIGAALAGAGGAAAATALRGLGEEASKRLLGPREKVRAGAVLVIAADAIRRRIEAGESIRSDGFFDPKHGTRSDADEVAENVLLKSQREPEERKIPYLGNLFAALSFSPDVSAEMAHQLIKISEQLTYRQFCILKLAVVKQAYGLRTGSYRNSPQTIKRDLYQVLYECMDLYHRGLVNFGGTAALGVTDVDPASMTIMGLGVDIFNLMQLISVPNRDLSAIAQQLKR